MQRPVDAILAKGEGGRATQGHGLGEHVMHHFKRYSVVLMFALGLPPAHATQPPDVVQSDAGGNTAMGTSALLSLGTYYSYSENSSENTAVGFDALAATSFGWGNTALGYRALVANSDSGN